MLDFAVVGAFLPTDELLPIAAEADRLGYTSLTLADHVVELETIETPYPYERSGARRWDAETEWPDPWVLVGALSAVTTRLRFFTSVYVPALRSPFQVAKSVGTAARLSGGRVSLGVGVGWCREEFEALGVDFTTRGRRTDEALDLLERLWEPGWTEYDGRYYRAPRLRMRPEPPARVPILVGGTSEVALTRAARHDGWIGDLCSTRAALAAAARLDLLRQEAGTSTRPFSVIVPLTDAVTADDFAAAAAGGITEIMTMPWMYYHGFQATLEQKLEGLQRFRDDVMAPLGAHTEPVPNH